MDYFLTFSTYALCFFTTYGIISFIEDIKEEFKSSSVKSASVKPESTEFESSKISESELSESELSENEFEFEPDNHKSDPTWEIPKKTKVTFKRKRT